MTVEPPSESDLFEDYIGPVKGDFDREYWIEHCVQFLGLDRSVAEERSTAWIVGWYNEKKGDTY